VFAAREKATHRQLAIKVIEAKNRDKSHGRTSKRSSNMLQFSELFDPSFAHWTAREVLTALYCIDREELSQIENVYHHPPICAIVMKQFAVIEKDSMITLGEMADLDGLETTEKGRKDITFPSRDGETCSGDEKKLPWLNEGKVCEVASHPLKALTTRLDLRMTHRDFSSRNFLVDERCKVS